MHQEILLESCNVHGSGDKPMLAPNLVFVVDQNFDLKFGLLARTWPSSPGEPREVGKLPLDKIYISIPYLLQKISLGQNKLRSFAQVSKTQKKITVASARRKIATSPGVRPNYSLSLADILRHLHKSFPSHFDLKIWPFSANLDQLARGAQGSWEAPAW